MLLSGDGIVVSMNSRNETLGSSTEVLPVVAEAAAFAGTADGYVEGHYPFPRRMGQFDRLQLGSFVVVPEDQLATNTYFGLRHTNTFFDVLLTNSSGKFYLVSNSVRDAPDGSLSATPWLGAFQSTPEGLVPDPRYTAWAGGITQTLTPDNQVRHSLTDLPHAEEFSFGDTTLEWNVGDGEVHVTGTLAGNGTQWRLPWREPDGNTGEFFYNMQGYSVEGTYFGEPVTGHLVLETMWSNDDYVSTWWVRNRVGHWAFFVNNYGDGTSEFGQILCGEFGARGAVVVDGQGNEVINTTELNAYEEADLRVRYDFGRGEEWEFVTDPARCLPRFGTTTLAVGAVKRVREPREADSARGPSSSRSGAHHAMEERWRTCWTA